MTAPSCARNSMSMERSRSSQIAPTESSHSASISVSTNCAGASRPPSIALMSLDPNEFGKMVKLQEAENQIIIDYEVYERRPNDCDLLLPAIETHQVRLGRIPRLVAADAAFYSAKNEAAAKARGVKRVCIPNRSTKSLERK